MRVLKVADLFCGAGGTSEGLRRAAEQMGCELDLVAINHWDLAIKSHTVNHPHARHYCTGVDLVDPKELVPSVPAETAKALCTALLGVPAKPERKAKGKAAAA